jgi:hypothetical protein
MAIRNLSRKREQLTRFERNAVKFRSEVREYIGSFFFSRWLLVELQTWKGRGRYREGTA